MFCPVRKIHTIHPYIRPHMHCGPLCIFLMTFAGNWLTCKVQGPLRPATMQVSVLPAPCFPFFTVAHCADFPSWSPSLRCLVYKDGMDVVESGITVDVLDAMQAQSKKCVHRCRRIVHHLSLNCLFFFSGSSNLGRRGRYLLTSLQQRLWLRLNN